MQKFAWLLALPLAAALTLLLMLAHAQPAAAVYPEPVAAPQPGSILTVNGYLADNNTANCCLTLREALLIARGGTGASGLNRALTDGEKAQLAGCTFTGSPDNWTISANCGAGSYDRIEFDIPAGTTITLGTSPLPHIDDSAVTGLDGGTVLPRIDAGAIGGGNNGLRITSDNNFVANIVIYNAPNDDFVVDGAHNTLVNVWAYGAGADGIHLSADGNTIDRAIIGLSVGFGCDGNGGSGISIVNSAALNVIEGSDIDCSGGDGILLDDGAANTTIISSAIGLKFVSNSGNGIRIQGGAHDNTVGGSTPLLANLIGANGANGILISGTTTSSTRVLSNTIENSTQSGVALAGNTHDNLLRDVLARLNAGNGILISGGAHDNRVINGSAEYNDRNGIELSNAASNAITGTVTHDNTLDGINTRNSAGPNSWSQISAHDNGGLGIDTYGDSDGTDDITGPYPYIQSVVRSGNLITLTGALTGSLLIPGAKGIEVYAAAPDPLGYGEGVRYEGTTRTDGTGHWTLTFNDAAPGCYTAFMSFDPDSAPDSGEFGPNTCSRLWLPVIRR